jgi:membrane-bound lytic murein transglycosylase B
MRALVYAGATQMKFKVALSALILFALAEPARAELVFFSSGRTLSVKSHRAEGDMVVLVLRAGGEMACDPSVVTRIAPDEVPYPEPVEPEVKPTSDVTQVTRPLSLPADQAAYATIIDRASAERGVDPRLVRAVIQVESGYQERARSPKGAMGLMQLMPETAKRYAVADPYDPVANIEAGIAHLKSLLDQFPPKLALAAYNAGEAAVRRFNDIPPYPETREYVSRILKLISR